MLVCCMWISLILIGPNKFSMDFFFAFLSFTSLAFIEYVCLHYMHLAYINLLNKIARNSIYCKVVPNHFPLAFSSLFSGARIVFTLHEKNHMSGIEMKCGREEKSYGVRITRS